MNLVNKYIDHVLEQIQSPAEEREDIREELLSHIVEAKSHYVEAGFSKRKAERKALSDFGDANNIGKNLQEAMYPFQRGLLYIIGIATILYGVIFYLNTAFNFNEIIPGWLAIQLIFGSAITLCAINISFVGRHFYLLHVLIIITLMWTGFNLMMTETIPDGRNIFFSLYLVILIIIGLVFMFRNSYYSTDVPKTKSKDKKALVIFSYICNLIFGLSLIAVGLFFIWGGLAFIGLTWRLVFPIIPILAWLIFYKFQMRFIAKRPIVSVFTGLCFSVLFVVLPLVYIYTY